MAVPRALAELSVPRYTSYPTAPQFSPAVGPQDYAAWLSALPAEATLSLYIHVPYCEQLCHYCGCHTKAVRRRDPVDVYADRLGDEIALVRRYLGGGIVVHVHWGGGTPSIIGAQRMVELFDELKARFNIASGYEHAIELDPRHTTRQLARALASMGVNRVSFGVQDFSAAIQQAIGRIQPFDVVARAVNELREAGINRFNLDLMYGLPGQTVNDVRRSAALAASLLPQRLAHFGYAHVPWLKAHQRLIDQSLLPDASERLKQAKAAHETLVDWGYVPIGIDHFARQDDDLAIAAPRGQLHRNFQGYTTDRADALISFGASAIGRFAQGFVQNAPDIGGYARAIAGSSLATTRGIALSGEDRLRAHIIERIMCDFTVDLERIRGPDMMAGSGFDAELAALVPLAAEGLVQLEGRRITMTDEGRPFVRLVAAAFDAYLAKSQARHSLAV
jgi:oxygen-independent coproporphyrinogen-3 oxidase